MVLTLVHSQQQQYAFHFLASYSSTRGLCSSWVAATARPASLPTLKEHLTTRGPILVVTITVHHLSRQNHVPVATNTVQQACADFPRRTTASPSTIILPRRLLNELRRMQLSTPLAIDMTPSPHIDHTFFEDSEKERDAGSRFAHSVP